MNRTDRDQGIDPRYLDAEDYVDDTDAAGDDPELTDEADVGRPPTVAPGPPVVSPDTVGTDCSLDDPAAGLAAGVGSGRGSGDDWRSRVRGSTSGTFLVLLLTAALVLGGVWYVNRPAAASGADGGTTGITLSQEGTGPAPAVGAAAPDFTATTVDGTSISLAGLRGHPVWLTFGASWCQACQAEMPDIEAAYEKAAPSGAVVVQVFISEDAATVKEYGERIGLTYPKVADPDTTIAAAYRVNAIPAQFFIDSQGVIRQMRPGAMSPDTMDAALAAIGR